MKKAVVITALLFIVALVIGNRWQATNHAPSTPSNIDPLVRITYQVTGKIMNVQSTSTPGVRIAQVANIGTSGSTWAQVPPHCTDIYEGALVVVDYHVLFAEGTFVDPDARKERQSVLSTLHC